MLAAIWYLVRAGLWDPELAPELASAHRRSTAEVLAAADLVSRLHVAESAGDGGAVRAILREVDFGSALEGDARARARVDDDAALGTPGAADPWAAIVPRRELS